MAIPENPHVCLFCSRGGATYNAKTWSYKSNDVIKWAHNAYCDERCEKWFEQHLEEERWRDPDYINKHMRENPDHIYIQSEDPGPLIERLRKEGISI